MNKKCKKCEVYKDIIDFYKHNCVCKKCHNQISREYKLKNKEKIDHSRREWENKNKEKRKEYKRKKLKEKRKNDPLFAIRSAISRNIRVSLTRNKFSKKSTTEEILGCSFEEFKIYLESKFEDWMTWENRGLYNGDFNYGWDIDHIIPISSANSEEDILKLNHYSNLQPLCSKFNRDIKGDKLI